MKRYSDLATRTGLTPSERKMRARLGAYALHSRYDGREITANARAAFMGKFVDEVDPNRELPEPERMRRAALARKRHFTAMAYRSARARRKG